MKGIWKRLLLLAAIVAVLASGAIGCKATERHNAGATLPESLPPQKLTPSETGSPAESAKPGTSLPSAKVSNDPREDIPATPPNDAVEAKQASVGEFAPAMSAPPVKTASNKPNDGRADSAGATASKPLKLMDIRLGDSKDAVGKEYGKPLDEYTMEDENESLLVYEYQGFSVGFRPTRGVAFVTVQSAEADARLGGLKIGSPVKDAIHRLGEPDSNTRYVLTYKADRAVLKLDVDPKSQIIRSIKLFQANSK